MREQYPAYQQHGAQILAISSQKRERGEALKQKLALPFPVLADHQREVIEHYGVFHDNEPKGRLIARPATFILDSAGTIRYRYIGEVSADRPSPETILEALEQIGGSTHALRA